MNNTPYAGPPSAPKVLIEPQPQPKPEPPMTLGRAWATLIVFLIVFVTVIGVITYVFWTHDVHPSQSRLGHDLGGNAGFVVCGILIVGGYYGSAKRRKKRQ